MKEKENRRGYAGRNRIDINVSRESTNANLTVGAKDKKAPYIKAQPNEVVKQIIKKEVGYDIKNDAKKIQYFSKEPNAVFTIGAIDKKNPNIRKRDAEIIINQKEKPNRQGNQNVGVFFEE